MESRYNYYATTRSDAELEQRIDNREYYMPETVEASIAELQRRGREFSDEELNIIKEDLQAHRQNASSISSRPGLFNNDYKNSIVKDPDAPQMYTRRALYVFTVLMGALFGSIMLAINAGKTEKKTAILWVMLFGIGFSALQYYVITVTHANSPASLQIAGGIISAYCLDYIFWRLFIGYSTFYRAKPIWMPLIIAVLLFALIIAAAILGKK